MSKGLEIGITRLMLLVPWILLLNLQKVSSESVNCSQNLPLLKVLPGRGWCNLRNKEMGQVQFFTYNLCKTTPDGLFLIPDNAFVIPVRESSVQIYAEIIDSWEKYSSATSKSINLNADASFGKLGSISGSFSEEYQTCKKSQVDDNSVTTRVQARYTTFTITTSVDDNLDPGLLLKLQRAINAIKANNDEEAEYLLELVVREHGTHLLTRVDAGASISQEEYVTRAYRSQTEAFSEVIKVSASARFFDRFGFSASYQHGANSSMLTAYENNLRSSHTQSFGGMLLKAHNMSIDEWVDSVPKNLVAIDREGDALHFIVTPTTFPNETVEMVDKLRLKLQGAIGSYYNYNKHIGCMDIGSMNFDYNANINNKVCQGPPSNYTFGGVFQTCTSTGGDICAKKNLEHKNILTQGFSCPVPYLPVSLMAVDGEVCEQERHESRHWSWFRWHTDVYYTTNCFKYNYTAHWCVIVDSVAPNNTGVMFGGTFTSTLVNPLTRTKACPPTFIEATLFEDNSPLHICIGNDPELGYQFSAKFGGLFSCQKGNPLYNQAENAKRLKLKSLEIREFPDLDNQTTKACPSGYTQHTAIIQSECLVSYCVKAGSFALHGEMPVNLPPFKNYTGIFSMGDPAPAGTVQPPGLKGAKGLLVAVVCLSVILASILVGFGGRVIWKRRAARLGQYDPLNDPSEVENSRENNSAPADDEGESSTANVNP